LILAWFYKYGENNDAIAPLRIAASRTVATALVVVY